MKFASISVVRNEADVIEAFVRHNAQFLDAMVIVDHRSVDGTAEVLRELAEEGLPLVVSSEESPVQRQAEVLTALMRSAARDEGADWVLPLDADEFLVSADGGGVRRSLEALPSHQPALIDMRTYVPCPDDAREEPDPIRRIQRRRASEPVWWYRTTFVPRRQAARNRCVLSQGSHLLLDAETGREVDARREPALALAHFPVRSADQLARKALAGWLANLARTDRRPGEAFQWKRVFDLVATGRRLSARRLQRLALAYSASDPAQPVDDRLVHDPVPARYELRCDAGRRPSAVSLVATTAEALIEELSDRMRANGQPSGG